MITSNKIYDLTTYKGFNTSVDFLKKYGWIISPIPWLIYKALSPEVSTEKQVDAAVNLIKAGKESGVKRMRIKVGHDAGIKVGAMMQGFPININVGNNGMVELEVDFESSQSNNTSSLPKTQ